MFGISLTTKCLEEFAIVFGLIGVQIVYSVYSVVMSHLMAIGLSPLFLIIYGSFATSFFLFPLSIYFERNKWPKKFSAKLLGQFVLIAFGGVTLFQYLMLIGIKKSSPAIASAMPNLAPGLIFVIAWVLRFEKVNLGCLYSKIKIMGTLICVVGAVTMSLLHDPGSTSESSQTSDDEIKEGIKIAGIMSLMTAVLMLSCVVVLQAATLGDFPAPMSLSAITSFIGAILTGIVKFIEERELTLNLPSVIRTGDLVGYAVMGGVVSGACTSFHAWAMSKKGPVFVSTFNPIGTVCAVILSALTLGDSMTLGSLIGMLMMFSGLYFVLWAKKKECRVAQENEAAPKTFDAEKPLLC